MNTKQKEQLLARYDDDSLTAVEHEQLHQLLQNDSDAQAILNQYRQINQLLADLPDPTRRVDFDRFSHNVSLAIDAVEPQWAAPKTTTRSFWRRLAPLAAAAVVMFALILRFAVVDSTQPVNSVQIVSGVSTQPIQESRQTLVSLSAPQHDHDESQLTPKSVAVTVTRQQWNQSSSAENQQSGEVLCFVTTTTPKQNRSAAEPIISLF